MSRISAEETGWRKIADSRGRLASDYNHHRPQGSSSYQTRSSSPPSVLLPLRPRLRLGPRSSSTRVPMSRRYPFPNPYHLKADESWSMGIGAGSNTPPKIAGIALSMSNGLADSLAGCSIRHLSRFACFGCFQGVSTAQRKPIVADRSRQGANNRYLPCWVSSRACGKYQPDLSGRS